MATAWQQHGKNVATTWYRHGEHMAKDMATAYMANTWRRHGKYMGSTWKIHGKDMVKTCRRHGKHIGIRWQIGGKHMTGTWQIYRIVRRTLFFLKVIGGSRCQPRPPDESCHEKKPKGALRLMGALQPKGVARTLWNRRKVRDIAAAHEIVASAPSALELAGARRVVGSMWGRFAVELGSSWGQVWVDLGSIWGPFWARIGVDLASLWETATLAPRHTHSFAARTRHSLPCAKRPTHWSHDSN